MPNGEATTERGGRRLLVAAGSVIAVVPGEWQCSSRFGLVGGDGELGKQAGGGGWDWGTAVVLVVEC